MKKTICIFLVFFLLFGFAVPAFAETTSDVISPVLEEPYDSYIIGTAGGYYYCWIYDSSVWNIFVRPDYGDNAVRAIFFGDDYSSRMQRSEILISDYNSSSSNNGWGSFIETNPIRDTSSGDGSVYYRYSVVGAPFLSNRDIPYAIPNWDTNSLDYTGEFFFTLTPPLVVEVEKALGQFQNLTTQNLMIIALCGVGCLAFLISLPILRKVLLRFLNR